MCTLSSSERLMEQHSKRLYQTKQIKMEFKGKSTRGVFITVKIMLHNV